MRKSKGWGARIITSFCSPSEGKGNKRFFLLYLWGERGNLSRRSGDGYGKRKRRLIFLVWERGARQRREESSLF